LAPGRRLELEAEELSAQRLSAVRRVADQRAVAHPQVLSVRRLRREAVSFRQPAACPEAALRPPLAVRRAADRFAATEHRPAEHPVWVKRPAAVLWSERLAVPAWALPSARQEPACRFRAAPSADQAQSMVPSWAARRASALPSERLSSDVPAVVFAGAVQPPAGERSSVPCAAKAAVAEEEASTGARGLPPGVAEAAAGALAQPRAAAEAPAGSVVGAVAEVALQAWAAAAVQPRAAVALRASAAEVQPRAAAGPDAPAARRRAALPSAAASFPRLRSALPAPAPSARSAPAMARLRIASP
jgi:hypothetical protein